MFNPFKYFSALNLIFIKLFQLLSNQNPRSQLKEKILALHMLQSSFKVLFFANKLRVLAVKPPEFHNFLFYFASVCTSPFDSYVFLFCFCRRTNDYLECIMARLRILMLRVTEWHWQSFPVLIERNGPLQKGRILGRE